MALPVLQRAGLQGRHGAVLLAMLLPGLALAQNGAWAMTTDRAKRYAANRPPRSERAMLHGAEESETRDCALRPTRLREIDYLIDRLAWERGDFSKAAFNEAWK